MPRSQMSPVASAKRTKPRRRRAIWYPVRLIGMGMSGILGAFLLFQLFQKVAYPYRLGDEEARRVLALSERLSRQQDRNHQLESQLRYLESDEGIETQARRAGYHRKGEEVYLLDDNAISAVQAPPHPLKAP